MPRSAENRSTMSNHAGEMVMRPASTLARSSRSLTISVSSRGRGWMNVHLLLLLVGQRAVERDPAGCRAMLQDRAERRAELVAHVREEAALQVRGLAQPVRVVVELRVERDDAAVGLLQLGRQRRRRSLPRVLASPAQCIRIARQSREMAITPSAGSDGTTIVASSRPRPKSRYSTPAMTAGCRTSEARVRVERPAAADAVRVHQQQPARRPRAIRRTTAPPHLQRRPCRCWLARPRRPLAADQRAGDVADAGVDARVRRRCTARRQRRRRACPQGAMRALDQDCRGVPNGASSKRAPARVAAAAAAWAMAEAVGHQHRAVARRARRCARRRRRPPRPAPARETAPTLERRRRGAVAGAADRATTITVPTPGIEWTSKSLGQPPHRAQAVARRAGGRVAVLQAPLRRRPCPGRGRRRALDAGVRRRRSACSSIWPSPRVA